MNPTDSEINAAIAILRHCGFTISSAKAMEWIAPIDLYAKLVKAHGQAAGSRARFLERMHHSKCPHVQRKVGPSGRLLEIRPTPELLAFLREPSHPGRR
jgi:hypothetical protein